MKRYEIVILMIIKRVVMGCLLIVFCVCYRIDDSTEPNFFIRLRDEIVR